MIEIGIKVLETRDPDLPLPAYATDGAAGMDIQANLAASERSVGLVLAPAARILVPTGLAFAIPDGFEVQIRPRSGLALRHGITLLNAPGTIDADYRGEIGIILVNLGQEIFRIAHGMRVAQMIVAPVTRATWRQVDDLDSTARGAGGFGSTGLDQ